MNVFIITIVEQMALFGLTIRAPQRKCVMRKDVKSVLYQSNETESDSKDKTERDSLVDQWSVVALGLTTP